MIKGAVLHLNCTSAKCTFHDIRGAGGTAPAPRCLISTRVKLTRTTVWRTVSNCTRVRFWRRIFVDIFIKTYDFFKLNHTHGVRKAYDFLGFHWKRTINLYFFVLFVVSEPNYPRNTYKQRVCVVVSIHLQQKMTNAHVNTKTEAKIHEISVRFFEDRIFAYDFDK